MLLEDNNNNIKKKGDSFTMRLDSIIDNIRKERKRNAQNMKMENLFKLKTTLNEQSNPQKQLSFNTTLNARDALDDLLLHLLIL